MVKRYFATLRGETEATPLDIEPLGEGRFAVTVNGKRREANVVRFASGAISLLVDGESFHVDFEDSDDQVAVLIRNQVFALDIADERKLRLRAGRAAFALEGKQTVRAPMPGKLVKVLVKLGDAVSEGQGLAVVEAMKMENELKSPKAGKVVELLAVEGSTVENNAPLLAVE